MKNNFLKSCNHVWLCDDDEDEHFLFTEALKQVLPEAQVSIYNNGTELPFDSTETPDILFLDINLPVENGVEILKKIRSFPTYSNIPIVMYSASEQKVDINACYDNGAILYVIKPQLFQDLIVQLRNIFETDWEKIKAGHALPLIPKQPITHIENN